MDPVSYTGRRKEHGAEESGGDANHPTAGTPRVFRQFLWLNALSVKWCCLSRSAALTKVLRHDNMKSIETSIKQQLDINKSRNLLYEKFFNAVIMQNNVQDFNNVLPKVGEQAILKKSLPSSPMRVSQTSALASQASRVNWWGLSLVSPALP